MSVRNQEKRPGAPRAKLCLSVPPDPKAGGYVRQQVIAFAKSQGIDGSDVTDFVAAIGEALANAIEHSHTSEPIEVAAWLLGDDRLFASVCDHGVGFSPNQRTRKPALPDAFAERGRGLPIMRKCSDMFALRSAPGEGTRVTLGCRVHRATGWQPQQNAG
jgi:anti-sigma regulatory factor (Ser/Thr protein kinase)